MRTPTLLPFLSLPLLTLANTNTTDPNLHSNVTVTTLTSNSTSAQTAASGYLIPFGNIGLGCGIDWREGDHFGGGIQAGSQTWGLGGGFEARTGTIKIGLGVGVGAAGPGAGVDILGRRNGTVEVVVKKRAGLRWVCESTDEGDVRCVSGQETKEG